MMPRPRPPAKVSTRLPSPANSTAASARSSNRGKVPTETTVDGAIRIPATPEDSAAMNQLSCEIRRAGIPMSRATSALSALARIARPSLVRLRKIARPTPPPAAAAKMVSS